LRINQAGIVEVNTEPLNGRIERRIRNSGRIRLPRWGHQCIVREDELDRILDGLFRL